MPLKCCMPFYNSNYDFTTKKVTVYKFSFDENEKIAFIKAIHHITFGYQLHCYVQ